MRYLLWPWLLDGCGWSAPHPGCFTPRKDPVPIVQEVGWAPAPVWPGAENLAPTGIRSLDHPAHSESLYQLRYPSPYLPVDFSMLAKCWLPSSVVDTNFPILCLLSLWMLCWYCQLFSDISHICGGSYQLSLILPRILAWDMSVHFRSAFVNSYACQV